MKVTEGRMSDIVSKDGTPNWAYDEDGYCVCCGNGHWKHHMPECELRDSLDAARKYANPDIDAATEAVSNEMANRRIDRYITDRDVWVEAAEALAVVAVDAALGVTVDGR